MTVEKLSSREAEVQQPPNCIKMMKANYKEKTHGRLSAM